MPDNVFPSIGSSSRYPSVLADNGLPRSMIQGFNGPPPDTNVNLFLTDVSRISNGTFGVVYKANLFVYQSGQKKKDPSVRSSTPQKPQLVAVKKVFQDPRFKNRELQIVRTLSHQNIVALKYYFKINEGQKLFLGLVLEYLPTTMYHISRENYSQRNISESTAKNFAFQLISGLAYIHEQQICHRDIKPHNILVDQERKVAKICDFGSAKKIGSEPSVAYICSRHYRAPELILGNRLYGLNIDVWSMGCVLAEIVLGKTLFFADTSIDQLTQIIKIIGAPSPDVLTRISGKNLPFNIPNLIPRTLRTVLQYSDDGYVTLLEEMLRFDPILRPSSFNILQMPYFQEFSSTSYT